MAVHEVTFTQSDTLVTARDMKFEVGSNAGKLGELHISKGGVDWKPKGAKKRLASFDWEQFAALVNGHVR